MRSLFEGRTRVKQVVLIGLLMTFGILLFERLLIWFSPQVGDLYQYDPELGFKVRPHTQGSNGFGFNDQDHPLQKPVDRYRIVVLGDSFNWIGGPDGNYTARLEGLFEEYYGTHRVDVINAGYPMTHTGEQLAALRKYAIQYDPDLLVLGFFCGNDISDADPYRKRIVVGGVYVDIDRRLEYSLFGSPAPPGLIFLSTVRKFFVRGREFVDRVLERLTSPGCESAGCLTPEETQGTFSRAAFLRIERRRLDFFDSRKHAEGEFDGNLQFAFANLSAMRDFSHSHGGEMVVALYPDEFQVNDDLLQDLFNSYDLDEGDYDLGLLQEVVIEHLRAEGIPFVDLLGEFRSRHKDGALYLPRDTHWNEQGNALAAKLLFEFLLPRVENHFSDQAESLK